MTSNNTGIITGEQTPLRVFFGPEGKPLTMDDLPPADTKRWVTKRKASLVACIKAGLLTLEEACERYSLSPEEFQSWQTLIESHGLRGLRATRIQHYRPAWTAPAKPMEKGMKNYLHLARQSEANDGAE